MDNWQIYTLDANTRNEITNALYAGNEVTVHESPVNAFGWTGSGYIIFDPDTGSGAYKISGGADGAIVVIALLVFALILIALSFVPALALAAWALFWVGAVQGLIALIVAFQLDVPLSLCAGLTGAGASLGVLIPGAGFFFSGFISFIIGVIMGIASIDLARQQRTLS